MHSLKSYQKPWAVVTILRADFIQGQLLLLSTWHRVWMQIELFNLLLHVYV